MPMDHPIQEDELGDSTTEVDSEESNQTTVETKPSTIESIAHNINETISN